MHGYRFRLVALLAIFPLSPISSEFATLFDGTSLSGWTAIYSKPGNWRVQDGCLVTLGAGKGWLSSNREFADFELALEYRVGPSGNSGVLIRAPHQGDPSFAGLEIQILDDDAPAYRQLKPDQYTGSVYGVIPARRGQTRPAGEWNQMRIRAIGSKIQVELNGALILDGDVSDHPEVLPRHTGIHRKSGFIGLQSHSTPVQFRNLLIKEIRSSTNAAGG